MKALAIANYRLKGNLDIQRKLKQAVESPCLHRRRLAAPQDPYQPPRTRWGSEAEAVWKTQRASSRGSPTL